MTTSFSKYKIGQVKYLLAAISILILVLVIGGAAFYFGLQSANQNKGMVISPTPTVFQTTTNVGTTSASTPTPTVKAPKSVTAGGILVFSKYSLSLPDGWTSQKEVTQYSDMLTITKGSYKITIYQAAGGGGGCTYPGEAPQEMAQSFSSFVEITDPSGFVFRRGANGTPGGFTVCQKNAQDGSFGFPTSFGNITITTPIPQDNTTMTEIDSILASINKQT